MHVHIRKSKKEDTMEESPARSAANSSASPSTSTGKISPGDKSFRFTTETHSFFDPTLLVERFVVTRAPQRFPENAGRRKASPREKSARNMR